MTRKQNDQLAAVEHLKALLPPNTAVYTILRHVSRSGMSRSIGLVWTHADGSIVELDGFVARAIGMPFDRTNGGVKMSGCGMDMGLALADTLSYALYGVGCAQGKQWPNEADSETIRWAGWR